MIRARDFRRIYSRGQRAYGRAMVVVAHRRSSPGHRLGLSVSKAHGRPVRRNKIKRILREAFRLERPTLPGRFDLILIPRERSGKYELAEVRAELVQLLQKLATNRRGKRPPKRPGR